MSQSRFILCPHNGAVAASVRTGADYKKNKVNLYGLIQVLSNPFQLLLSASKPLDEKVRDQGRKTLKRGFKLIFPAYFYNQIELCKTIHTFFKTGATIVNVFSSIDFIVTTVLSV